MSVSELSQRSHPESLGRTELWPADKVVIAYLAVVATLVVVSHSRIPDWWLWVAAHAMAIGLVVIITRGSSHGISEGKRPVIGRLTFWLRHWYPIILIPTTYKELGYLVPRIHPRDFDWELERIDYSLFGLHPGLWLDQIVSPFLTEIFQVAYICYYLLPVGLALVLWLEKDLEVYRFFLFTVVLGVYLSYIGYIAVPALGPRFILADQYTAPLGGVLAPWIRAKIDQGEGLTRDCFPSGHTELTLLVLYYAWRFRRRVFWLMLPIGTALILSTVYLRYHYVIDVAAGALLALLIIISGNLLYKKLNSGRGLSA